MLGQIGGEGVVPQMNVNHPLVVSSALPINQPAALHAGEDVIDLGFQQPGVIAQLRGSEGRLTGYLTAVQQTADHDLIERKTVEDAVAPNVQGHFHPRIQQFFQHFPPLFHVRSS